MFLSIQHWAASGSDMTFFFPYQNKNGHLYFAEIICETVVYTWKQ